MPKGMSGLPSRRTAASYFRSISLRGRGEKHYRCWPDIAPDVRVLNLETSITSGGDFAPGKAVHYRMYPQYIGCLTAIRPDVCALANNHILDFGYDGLVDTLRSLAGRQNLLCWCGFGCRTGPTPGGGDVA